MKRVAFYLRVSPPKLELRTQRRELEAVASRSGWQVVKIYEDAGNSGASGMCGWVGWIDPSGTGWVLIGPADDDPDLAISTNALGRNLFT